MITPEKIAELKRIAPCPKCGGRAVYETVLLSLDSWSYVFCTKCDHEGHYRTLPDVKEQEAAAIESWNKEALPKPPQ